MPNTALGTVAVQQIAAGKAQPRFERVRCVVDSGVDDFAVARTGVHAEPAFALENHDLPAAPRQRPCHGKSYDAGADHDAIDIVQDAA
jgi:hypothetical protein